MGAISSVLGAARVLTQAAGAVSGLAGGAASNVSSGRAQELALQQLKVQQDLQMRQSESAAALSREQIALNAGLAEGARKTALRRAVARQRASFGAQGVGSGAGSSQAVLLGMFEESEDERKKREDMDALKLRALDQDLVDRRATNVLQRTQLEQRGRLDDVSGYARWGDLVSGVLR